MSACTLCKDLCKYGARSYSFLSVSALLGESSVGSPAFTSRTQWHAAFALADELSVAGCHFVSVRAAQKCVFFRTQETSLFGCRLSLV